jgi:hypothetical protein
VHGQQSAFVPNGIPAIAPGIINAKIKINHSGNDLNRCKKLS